MTLDNLIGKLLERINPDSAAIQRLLEAAQRNIKDSELAELSNENRFDAAYKAIMQLANAALQAAGLRTLTSKPDHHQRFFTKHAAVADKNSGYRHRQANSAGCFV